MLGREKRTELWGVAWRSAVSVSIIVIIAYLSSGYGWQKRHQIAVIESQVRAKTTQENLQQAYEYGLREGLASCQGRGSSFMETGRSINEASIYPRHPDT